MKTKSRLIASALLALALAAVALAAQPKTVTLTDKDAGRATKLNLGDKLVVKLVSNPTTGYGWKVGVSAPAILTQVGKPAYISDPNPRPGSGGTEVFTFKAAKTGKAKLVFTYQRSWEKVPPVKTITFDVSVVKPKPAPPR